MIKRLDTFLLDKAFAPVVHFVDHWLHLNQYRQAWYLTTVAAIGVITSFIIAFVRHEHQNWIWYFIFLCVLGMYVAITNELSKLGERYEKAPWEVMKLGWASSGPYFRVFCLAMDMGLYPMHWNFLAYALWFSQVCFSWSWYVSSVKRPNKPRHSYSFGHVHAS